MKRRIQIIVSALLILCLTAGILSGLGQLTVRKDSQIKYQEFFDEEEDFDVLFLGSSHMMNAVYPMELWDDYGIVSYNLGGHASTLCVSYWMLQNALDYTTPEVVVIDCMGISNDYKVHSVYEYLHQTFDAFPLSLNKVRAVLDLVGDSQEGAGDKRSRQMEILWNFTTYHNRWSELDQSDFEIIPSTEKGAEMRIAVATPNEIPEVAPGAKYEGDDYGLQYLIRLIEDCKARGIEVLLTFVPFPADERRMMECNAIYDIAKEYDLHYINFMAEDVVDFTTDCYDSNSHLNASGARKVTDYLGSYLVEHYGVEDHRDDPAFADWYEDHEAYAAYKLEQLIANDRGYRYLMMLSDEDYSFILELDRWSQNPSERYLALLRNLGIDPEQIDEDVRYVIVDRAEGTLEYVSLSALEAGPVETPFGSLSLDDQNALLLDGQTMTDESGSGKKIYDFRAIVFSPEGEFLDYKQLYLD